MRQSHESSLHKLLFLDLRLSATSGAGLAALFWALADPLGTPNGWLFGLGVFFLVFAAFLWWICQSDPPVSSMARVAAVGNMSWAVLSIGVIVADVWPLTNVGVGAVFAQAVVVGYLGVAQFGALRRM